MYIFIALLTTAIIYGCMKPLAMVPLPVLWADACVSGIVLSILLFLLYEIVKYTRFATLPFKQQVVNYTALAILFVFFWLGADLLALYTLFPQEEWIGLLPISTTRIVLSLLVYVSAILFYNNIYKSNVQSSDENADEFFIAEDDNIENHVTEEIKPNEELERVAVKNGQRIEVIPVSNIIYIQAEGDYVMIYSDKGKFLKEQTMKSFESLLPSNKFVRVHRSSIVNVDFIAQIELYNKQSQLLKLKDGSQVRISMNGYRLLKQTLGL
ncbi:LytTR family DNA-binding domain-containing protein [uncultured Dysgonomonas sp.]|uniref:LytR/AlgR family response regulator transcription factor n=1 Tax=uncultured Dysgonomonas sp. TaxID=206096 RepID=UPI002805629D|nr:LytTR family DNA-binding domain-containing protein [uncultured Dysgonomonas sp.]